MAGLDPAIQPRKRMLCGFRMMPGSRPGMTIGMTVNHLNASEHWVCEGLARLTQQCDAYRNTCNVR
jgi:hypothetical protein